MKNKKYKNLFTDKYNICDIETGNIEFIMTIKTFEYDDSYYNKKEYTLTRSDNPHVWTGSYRNEDVITVIDDRNGLIIKPLNFNIKTKKFDYDNANSLYRILDFINHVDDNLFIKYKYEKI
jgi:hypothetical protein